MCSPGNKHLAQVILRSDDGETWTEHVSDYVNSGEIYQVVEQENVLLELVKIPKYNKKDKF